MDTHLPSESKENEGGIGFKTHLSKQTDHEMDALHGPTDHSANTILNEYGSCSSEQQLHFLYTSCSWSCQWHALILKY